MATEPGDDDLIFHLPSSIENFLTEDEPNAAGSATGNAARPEKSTSFKPNLSPIGPKVRQLIENGSTYAELACFKRLASPPRLC